MKDIPLFTTQYGAASLVLREIPYQKIAYVTLQATQEPEKLLEECVAFCRMCGAEKICAKGHDFLVRYPLYTALWQMRCSKEQLPETDAALWPVQAENVEKWRSIYNEKVVRVPNGAWMTAADGEDMVRDGSGYFVHRDAVLLGIGKVADSEIQWLASVQPGAGADVAAALSHAVASDTVELTVASENTGAVKLYEKLGFVRAKELSRWYKII